MNKKGIHFPRRPWPTLGLCIFLASCEQYLEPTNSFEVATKGIHAGAIDEQGKSAIVGSIYHGGSYWQVGTQERLFNWNHKPDEASTITVADFSFNGQYAITADPYTLVLWSPASGEATRFWTAPGEILDAKLGPKGRLALLGLSDHSAVLFDIQRGGIKRTLTHNNRVRSVDISENGRWALTGSEDYHARFWDLSSGKLLKNIKHKDDVQLVELSDDGSLALSVSKYDEALLWNTQTGEPLGAIPLKAQQLKRGVQFTSAAFSADNTYLLTGRPDQIVQLWRTETLELVNQWQLPKRDKWKPTGAAVVALAFGEQERTYYAMASNGFIHTLKR